MAEAALSITEDDEHTEAPVSLSVEESCDFDKPFALPADVAFDCLTLLDDDGPDLNFDGAELLEGDAGLPADVEFDLVLLSNTANGETPATAVPTDEDENGDVEIVGLAVDEESPGFDEQLALRAAASRPVTHRVTPRHEMREWTLDFGPLAAPAGFVSVITASPQCLFRGEKIVATDSLNGIGTRILQVTVGNKIQRPGNGGNGTLTSMFAASALANGITFDTAHRWANIKMTVSFVQACTFDATVFGKAVL